MSIGTSAAIAAGIGAVGSIGSSLIGAHAAGKAGDQQAAAALKAQSVADQNKQQGLDVLGTNTTASNDALNNLSSNLTQMFKPYQDTGAISTTGLNSALQNPFQFNIQDDPGYQFRLQQGMKAVQQSAAAGGALGSGGALKALTQYGQGFASNEYQNAFNRHQTQLQNLFQGAGLGLQATGQNAGLQSGVVGQQVGNLTNNSNLTAQILGQDSTLASQNYTGAGNAQAEAHLIKASPMATRPAFATWRSAQSPPPPASLPPGWDSRFRPRALYCVRAPPPRRAPR